MLARDNTHASLLGRLRTYLRRPRAPEVSLILPIRPEAERQPGDTGMQSKSSSESSKPPLGAPPPSEILAFRAELGRVYGARILDNVMVNWHCPACDEHVPDQALRTIGAIEYACSRTFLEFARHWLRQLPALTCSCGESARVTWIDHHAHVSRLRQDLVARWKPAHESTPAEGSLWWWDGVEFRPCERLSSEEERAFQRDIPFRKAQIGLMLEGDEVLLEALEDALAKYPGDPELLEFTPFLLGRGRNGITGAIAEVHIAQHPKDHRGYATLGSTIVQAVYGEALPPSSLQEAETLFTQALELQAGHVEALAGLANVAKLRGNGSRARELYRAIIKEHPEDGVAVYALAVESLREHPEEAKALFERGLELDPEDVACWRGLAKALKAMGRDEEADEAAANADALGPAPRSDPSGSVGNPPVAAEPAAG